MANQVLLIPWILFSGFAAEHTNFVIAMANLGPKELTNYPVYNFYYFVPITGVSIVAISTLFWIGAKRSPGNGQSIPFLTHLIPGAFLTGHALNTEWFYYAVSEAPGFEDGAKSFESGLNTNISLIMALFSCGLLAVGLNKIRLARAKDRTQACTDEN
jgi:FtsH-binding integral membrane protein